MDAQAISRKASLVAEAVSASIVILGGIVKAEKLRILAAETWHEVEWIPTHGMRMVDGLESRLRQGRIALLVILDGLCSHKHYARAIEAARASGVPVAYAGRAGLASLRRAVATLSELAPKLPPANKEDI